MAQVLEQQDIDKYYKNFINMDAEELFLREVKAFGIETTNMDILVHLIYIHNQSISDFNIDKHIRHQYEIIKLLTRKFEPPFREFQYLNNPERKYPGKYYLNGSTGFMSSLLVNCQYILYDFFFNNGVNINMTDDALIIFLKLIKTNLSILPDVEMTAIINILTKYKQMCRNNCDLLNSQWYYDFISNYKLWANDCMAKPWYKSRYGNKHNFDIIIDNNGRDFLSEYINKDKTFFVEKDLYAILNPQWEYKPAYMTINIEQNVSPNYLIMIGKIMCLINIGKQKNINVEKTNKTDTYSKYIKYKSKYLNLKKLIKE
jgi:hypothetical protein